MKMILICVKITDRCTRSDDVEFSDPKNVTNSKSQKAIFNMQKSYKMMFKRSKNQTDAPGRESAPTQYI